MIDIKYTKTAMADPAQMLRLKQPMAIAQATAYAIRDRVVNRGQLATSPQGFSTTPDAGPKKCPRYYISPEYAEKAGLGTQTRWESSQAMHAALGAKPGQGHATGKMWEGLQVRNSGDTAIIEFGGSSTGASSTRTALTQKVHGTYEVTLSDNNRLRAKQVTELKRDEGGQVQYRRKPKLVRNQVKAGTVFANSKIGLLQPTESEQAAQWTAFRDFCARMTSACFGGQVPAGQPQGDAALYTAITKGFK